jgi:hypothetical protein
MRIPFGSLFQELFAKLKRYGHKRNSSIPSFQDGPKDQTRNLEIPGSMLRIAPE